MKQKFTLQMLIVALIVSFLAACSSGSRLGRTHSPLLSAATYLQLAQVANPPQDSAYRLLAVQRLIQDRQLSHAQLVLAKVQQSNLPATQLLQRQLLQANIWLLTGKAQKAIGVLKPLASNPTLSQKDRLEIQHLLASAYLETNNVLASIMQQTQSLSLLNSNSAKQQVVQAIWHSLQTLPIKQLQALLPKTTDPTLQGWLHLAIVGKQTNQPPQHLLQQLSHWRQNYPDHPANSLLPRNLPSNPLVVASQAKKIALLLPMHGPLASRGQAIRNGFFAAYYYDKKRRTNAPTIRVYDTSSASVTTLYHQALAQGASFVVGPLTKANVNNLIAHANIEVPTLTLNTVNRRSPNNLFQFGLSPLDDATQAATKAWHSNHNSAVIIAPANSWGQGVANAFRQQWQRVGGRIAAQGYYTNQSSLSATVRRVLDINQAEGQAQSLKRVLRQKLRYIPQRRQDFDMVFLVAFPNTGRQIVPLLKYYYAGKIPIYSPSVIYSGVVRPRQDRDLNGVVFCDTPWAISSNRSLGRKLASLRTSAQSIWPSSFQQNSQLYALGVDAYDLISQLKKMALLPQFGVSGATGILYLTNNRIIYRKLLWAQMQNGRPKILH